MIPALILPPLLWLVRLLACSFPFATGSLQPVRTHAGWKTFSRHGKVGKIKVYFSRPVGQELARRT